MSGLRKALIGGLSSVVIFFVALEIGLRVAPVAIPLALLQHFEPGLRSRIASSRELTTRTDTVLLPRNDGGPADRLWIYRPEAKIRYNFDEPGIVEDVRVDKQGFCNPTPNAYAESEKFDVVVVGDSFSWCLAVEPSEAWPSRFSRLTGLDTYNLGIGGRGLYEYLQLLKMYGLPKKPRIVVMNVYEGNDFRDAFLFHRARAESGSVGSRQLLPTDPAFAQEAEDRADESFLGRHSYAYNSTLAARRYMAARAVRKEIDFKYSVSFSDGSSVGMNSRNGDRDEVEFARMLERRQLSVDLFDAALDEYRRLAVQWDFVPVLLYTPSAYTAYEGMTTFDDPGIERTMRNYSRELRRYFSSKADEFDFVYRDLTPYLAAAARTSSAKHLLYFRTNVHFTQSGHEVVAVQLADLIRDDLDVTAAGETLRVNDATGRPSDTPR